MNIYHKYSNKSAIDSIKESYRNNIARIDANAHRLSDEGLRIERGRAYVNATRQMDMCREEFRTKVKGTKERLERQLYGANSTDSGDIVAMRDAQDRAARLDTDAKTVAAWKQAHYSGDVGLQKAIAAHANRRGFEDTMRIHTDEYPATQELFRELRQVPTVGEIGETALFALPKPAGFGRGDIGSIESEIERSDEDASPRPSPFL